FVAGLLFGSSAPGLIDLVSSLPGFALALNYRLVFLAPLGLAGLAAFGMERACQEDSRRTLSLFAAGTLLLLTTVYLDSLGIFRGRALPDSFVRAGFAWQIIPLGLLAVLAFVFPRNGRAVLFSALLLLVGQRTAEMTGTYPTLPSETVAPDLPELARLPADSPWRIVAVGDAFRPNAAALYGLEDARGYESLLLDRFSDTFPLWSKAQFASFNRVDALDSPFLSFLNVRFAFAPPEVPVPRGWQEWARGRGMTVFENPRVLSRAFVPARLRSESDPARILAAMSEASDFSESAWILSEKREDRANGIAEISTREAGPDLLVTISARKPVFVATSLPDWPGWRGETDGGIPVRLVTVNHAFIGFRIESG